MNSGNPIDQLRPAVCGRAVGSPPESLSAFRPVRVLLDDSSAGAHEPRKEMYDFVVGGGEAYAFNHARTHYAMLEAVNGPRVQYVKTVPDRVKSDNLLSLPRY